MKGGRREVPGGVRIRERIRRNVTSRLELMNRTGGGFSLSSRRRREERAGERRS